MRSIVLSGDRPTGHLHLGHYVGSLLNRIKFQEDQEKYTQYIMIADVQALTDNYDNPKKITENVYNIAEDYISAGISFDKNIIFVQSQIPEISQIAMYFMNLVTIGRLERNPTVKMEIKQTKFEGGVPSGFLCYPISQAADILSVKGELIPVGADQLPMIEQANEIVRKFNNIYKTNCLKEVKAIMGTTQRLIGIDGKAKASKSLGNAIFLTDTPEEIKAKVFSMFTDPNHIKITDPGRIEGNVVFSYLDAFHDNKEEIDDLKKQYQKGGLGDVVIKTILNDTLQKFFIPLYERRSKIKRKDVIDMLEAKTIQTRRVVQNTLGEIHNVMGIKYF